MHAALAEGRWKPLVKILTPFPLAAAVYALHRLLEHTLDPALPVFILFYPTVILTAMYLGRWPGIVASALAAITAHVCLIEPAGHWKLQTFHALDGPVVFLAASIFLTVILDRYRSSLRRIEAIRGQAGLAETQAKLKAALQAMSDAVFISDKDGNFIECNQAVAAYHKWNNREECSKSISDCPAYIEAFFPDGTPAPPAMWAVSRALRGETAANVEYTLRRKDTGEIWNGLYSFSPIRDSSGAIAGSVVVAQDITSRKRAEEALRQSEVRFRAAFLGSQDAIAISTLAEGRVLEINPRYTEIIGYAREDVIGKTSVEFGMWPDAAARAELRAAVEASEICRNLQFQLRHKNGQLFWAMLSTVRLELNGETCILSTVRDLTPIRKAAEEIQKLGALAFFDPLTALPNRRLLLDRLQKSMALSMRTGQRRALLMIDIDDFKALNDTLGHSAGDCMLEMLAQRLMGCVRESDTVGRLGGDEFLILLEGLSADEDAANADALAVAEKVLAAAALPYDLGQQQWLSSCSIGVTIFGDRRLNGEEIIRQADCALYQAKVGGRKVVRVYDPSLRASAHRQESTLKDIRRGLDDGQFALVYQPIVASGRMIGAEALLRWNHPAFGVMMPSSFIALAEGSGLVVPLGQWVLESACRHWARWTAQMGRNGFYISVNVSARELRDAGFVHRVLDALQLSGAKGPQLTLELTESALVDDVDEAIAKMNALKAYGVSFSLDDFGTGYSSLSYLSRLPLRQIKIDSSFVRFLNSDPNCRAIVEAVVALGRALAMEVLAEGVETAEQHRILAGMGCRVCQGILFGRPMREEELGELLLGAGGNSPSASRSSARQDHAMSRAFH